MTIGMIIGRIGGIDGVALEAEKWIHVLRRMGHEVYILSGQYQERPMNHEFETLVPEMSFFSPESFWSQKKAFFHPDTDLDELKAHIFLYSNIIANKIKAWVKDKKLQLLISENASSLPSHLEMGFGIRKAAQQLDIPIITHDHDFAWERGDRYLSPHEDINRFIAENFPLRLPNSYHAVINTNAQRTLLEKYGRDAVVVPNVMNFDQPFGEITEKNKNLRENLGFDKNDILLFQITRIVSRKAIEVAIELVHRLDDPRLKLIITGSQADDEGNRYYQKLVDLIHDLKLGSQVRFASDNFHNRGLHGQNREINYSLSDAYAHARACTYFSTYEGFGNAFVEAVLARTPIFVNNYKPVFWPDIGSKGFKTVMLENNRLTGEKVREMAEIIYNDELNREIGEYNFQLGKKYFSYDVLEQKLHELIRHTGLA
ncbi:MAG TPA: glycosyltransferase [Bacteroidetes bacterium]|nr:glycosyltransferase [Bacteroidota bacterium]